MESHGYAHDHEPEPEPEPRVFLSSLVDRTLGCLSGLRPYAHRTQRAECDRLHREGVVLAHDIDHESSPDLLALCTRTDTWMDKVMAWTHALVDTVRGLWGVARTRFTPRRPPEPTGQPSPDPQPSYEQLVADVQVLKTDVANLKEGLVRLENKVDAGFAQINAKFAQVDANFARVDQELHDGFAKVDQELSKARRHREHIMANRRLGIDLERNLQGFALHTVNRTLGPLHGANAGVKVLWEDGGPDREWYSVQSDLALSLAVYANRIDRLIEIEWSDPSSPRMFLACEATHTLDRAHIDKLTNACREIAAADHRVIGVLGYIKAPAEILAEARATDAVLWNFTEDIVHFTEETAGPPLTARLQALVAEITIPQSRAAPG